METETSTRESLSETDRNSAKPAKKKMSRLEFTVHLFCFVVMIIALVYCYSATLRYFKSLDALHTAQEKEDEIRVNTEKKADLFFNEQKPSKEECPLESTP